MGAAAEWYLLGVLQIMMVSQGSGEGGVQRMSVGAWVCLSLLNFACRGASGAALCDPGVQSHPLDVSTLLLLFAWHPEELRRRTEVGRRRTAGGTNASCSAPASNAAAVVAITAFEGAGVAAHAVGGRAASRGLQGQQGAWVLRRCAQYGSPWGGGGGGWRGAGGAAVPARWDRLRLDADAGACVDGKRGALRYMSHRPGNRDRMEDKRKREGKHLFSCSTTCLCGIKTRLTSQGTEPTGKGETRVVHNAQLWAFKAEVMSALVSEDQHSSPESVKWCDSVVGSCDVMKTTDKLKIMLG